MTWPEMLVVLAAGVAAGGVNAIVGSGSLITFPALVAVGLPPVTANVSNTIGLVPVPQAREAEMFDQRGGDAAVAVPAQHQAFLVVAGAVDPALLDVGFGHGHVHHLPVRRLGA